MPIHQSIPKLSCTNEVSRPKTKSLLLINTESTEEKHQQRTFRPRLFTGTGQDISPVSVIRNNPQNPPARTVFSCYFDLHYIYFTYCMCK